MDYIGSKVKLNDWIFRELSNHIPKNKWHKLWFLDGCAGSCATSKYALKEGFKVISNYLFTFSSAIIRGFSNFDRIMSEEEVPFFIKLSDTEAEINYHINNINKIDGVDGFFFHNYSESSGRKFFTDDNARKIDAARLYIDTISDKYIKEYILYIALEGISAIMNTTGVQAAFLKRIKERAKQPFRIKIQPSHRGEIRTFNIDLAKLVSVPDLTYDILYIDPPYNNRQYGPNYHLYETFIRYDNPRLITEVVGLRDWHNESKSDFCYKRTCAETFRKIIRGSSAKIIMISYSSDGLLSKDELLELCGGVGRVKLYCMDQVRYKADTSIKRNYNESELQEFLFIFGKK
jgi:adenine-specific DNA-methyltransferase